LSVRLLLLLGLGVRSGGVTYLSHCRATPASFNARQLVSISIFTTTVAVLQRTQPQNVTT